MHKMKKSKNYYKITETINCFLFSFHPFFIGLPFLAAKLIEAYVQSIFFVSFLLYLYQGSFISYHCQYFLICDLFSPTDFLDPSHMHISKASGLLYLLF